jgi:signal transduction histidine kinase
LGAGSTAPKECRVAVSDITAIKQAEALRNRALESLADANEEQRREIVRRKAIEEALERNAHQQRVMLEQSRSLHAQLRHLTHEVLQVQEEERKRISRDLHDEITQTLVGINIHLESLSREATTHPGRLKAKIVRTQRVVEKAVDSVHRFARELRPAMLDDLGLIPALQTFLKAFTQKTGIRVSLNASIEIEQVKGTRRAALYRVAQEALTNVSRHSRATQAEVILQRVPGGVLMQVKDNGKSFDVESVRHDKQGKRLGLIGMQERMEMVGGKFSVLSAPGQGTTIQAQIPLRNTNQEQKQRWPQ